MSFCDIGTQNDANLALYLCSSFSSVSAISADYIFLRRLTESLKKLQTHPKLLNSMRKLQYPLNKDGKNTD